jgi:NAD(P)H-dependent FMN reductase
MLRIAVVYGSVRSGRQGIKAARFITEEIRQRGHDTRLIDAVEHPLPLLDRMYKEYPKGGAPEMLERIARIVIAADAYVVVTGEYNHNVPPGLANLLDHFLEEYFWKPSAIVSYSAGAFGGVRAAVALREMLAEMGMSSIPSTLPVPRVQDAFDDEGRPQDEAWHKRAAKFLAELEWYAEALRAARVKDGRDTSPGRSFCELLRVAGTEGAPAAASAPPAS